MQPQYIRHKHIDMKKWDAALALCPNRLLYAETAYLNRMAVEWDAVIGGDYEWLMPLPVKHKWGMRYTPVVPFVQQLGIFAPQPVSSVMVQSALTVMQRHIRYADLLFNYASPVNNGTPHNNYILQLQPGYERLVAAYSKDLRNNLKQAAKHELAYEEEDKYNLVIDLFQQQYRRQLPHVEPAHYSAFSNACAYYAGEQAVICRTVYDDRNLLAGAVLIRHANRLYNLLSVNTPEGRSRSANHFLYGRLIDEFAGQELLLDFEGSDVPGIASFYQNFGGVNQPYYSLHINKLPWPLKWLK